MRTYDRRVIVSWVAWAAIVWLLPGCVSNSTYELAKRDAENAKLQYQNEQHRTQELAATNKQIKAQVEALQVALEDAQKKFERVDRDWRETRDELMKLKIEREQQLARSRGRRGEGELAVPGASADSEETKRRIKELVQRLQAVLNQF